MPKQKNAPVSEESAPATRRAISILSLSAEEVENAQGFHAAPADIYPIEVSKVLLRFSKKGAPMLENTVRPLVEDDPLVGQFRDYVNLPYEGIDKQQREMRNLQLREFCQSCNINIAEFLENVQLAFSALVESKEDSAELPDYSGLQGRAIVLYEDEGTRVNNATDENFTNDDGTDKIFPASNRIKRWVVSK